MLLGILAITSFLLMQTHVAERNLDDSNITLRLQSDLYSSFQDMNLASRGYVITQDKRFLDFYDVGRSKYESFLGQLEKLNHDSPTQMRDLEDVRLHGQMFCEVTAELVSRCDGQLVVRQKYEMDAIRFALHKFVDEEESTAAKRRRITIAHYLWGETLLVVQVVAALCLLYGIWRLLRRYGAESRAKIMAEVALETQSRFLATISHEVRTPLSGVVGLTELLSLQDLGPDNNATVKAVLDSSKRLLHILNNLLEASRLDSGEIKLECSNFSVQALLGDVRQLIVPEAAKKKLVVSGTCDDKIPESVCGDELRVRQVLLYFCFNAVKFTEKGSIQVSAALREQTATQTVIRFTVQDSGVGISRDQQVRIFEPFERATPASMSVHAGAGLGLSIAKSLVELMHGEIGVTSELGQGSLFWFEVPFVINDCEK